MKISCPNGLSKCPDSREIDFGHFRQTHFLIIFWAQRRKAVRQGFDPELFMTELSCHQLGAKIKLFILTFRPRSIHKHEKNKVSCRCGERVRLKMTLPAVCAENKKYAPGSNRSQKWSEAKFLEKVQEPVPWTRDT